MTGDLPLEKHQKIHLLESFELYLVEDDFQKGLVHVTGHQDLQLQILQNWMWVVGVGMLVVVAGQCFVVVVGRMKVVEMLLVVFPVGPSEHFLGLFCS